MSRLDDLKKFYEILDDLEQRIGGARILGQCDGAYELAPKWRLFLP